MIKAKNKRVQVTLPMEYVHFLKGYLEDDCTLSKLIQKALEEYIPYLKEIKK